LNTSDRKHKYPKSEKWRKRKKYLNARKKFLQSNKQCVTCDRYDEDVDLLDYLIIAKVYANCEDRLNSVGTWLIDLPTRIIRGQHGWEITDLKSIG